MNSQTNLIATDFRLRQWASEIQACQNRPAGMEVQEWLSQNNISKAAYYYHLKKVREACIELTESESIPQFVEVPLEDFSSPNSHVPASDNAVASIKMPNGIRIHLYEQASSDFMHRLMGVIFDAQ